MNDFFSWNGQSFFPVLLLSLHSSPLLPRHTLHLSSHSFFPPLLSTRLVSSPSLHLPFHFFRLLSSSMSPLSLLNACLFLHLSVTRHFFLAFTPSRIRVLFSRKPCLCSFLEFRSLQNTRSPLLVATREAEATNAAISRHLNESNFLLDGLPACPYIHLPLKSSDIKAN